jgi:hypothetical protein
LGAREDGDMANADDSGSVFHSSKSESEKGDETKDNKWEEYKDHH